MMSGSSLKTALAFLVGCVVLPGQTAPYCSLAVSVTDYLDKPASGVDVAVHLRDSSERQVQATNNAGVAHFCDLGFGLFDVVIGPPLCGQVRIQHLAVRWPEPTQVKARYGSCHSSLGSPVCNLLVRAADENGSRVTDIEMEFSGKVYRADQYGRIFATARPYALVEAVVRSPSYIDQQLSLSCDAGHIGKEVRLKRR